MIQLSGIEKEYGRLSVLHDIDFHLEDGESVALVGESGAGKTTLSRILLKLVMPTRGKYLFDDCDVSQLTGKALRSWRYKVQAVFQNPTSSLNPRMRIDKLITEPIEARSPLRGAERQRVAMELLDAVGLATDLSDRYPHQLSGGQQQRVAIARAIGPRPRLIILDEPVSSLDVSVKAQVLNTLRDLRKERQIAYVYVTHDLATVPYLCERAYVMYKGWVVEEIGTADLAKGAVNPYTQMLLASVPYPGRGIRADGSELRWEAGLVGGWWMPFQFAVSVCGAQVRRGASVVRDTGARLGIALSSGTGNLGPTRW